MAPRTVDADEIARYSRDWYRRAEVLYRKTPDGSADELAAIQAMSLAALAGLVAQQCADKQ